MQAHDHEAGAARGHDARADARVDDAAEAGAAKERQAFERPGGYEYQYPGARNPRGRPEDGPKREPVLKAHCKSRKADDEKPGSNRDARPDAHRDRGQSAGEITDVVRRGEPAAL